MGLGDLERRETQRNVILCNQTDNLHLGGLELMTP